MNAKKLLKKHLDIQISKNEYRSEKQLTQLRYDASINAINEALNLPAVGVPKGEQLCQHDNKVTNRICDDCGQTITYVPD